MAEGVDPNTFHWLHVLWGTLSGIVVWNGKQMFKRLDNLEDHKAEKDAVAERHLENISNFEKVIKRLDDLGLAVHNVSLDVNTLMERSRAEIAKEKHR